jgi:1-phosphofructokinase
MIVTLTPNTAIDRTYFIPGWSPNRAIRASHSALGTGGKGVDASWILAEMGLPSLALGFAAGPTGRQLENLLKAKGVTPDFTWVDGETRTNIVLVCEDGSGQSTISADTLRPREADSTILVERYRRALEGASCVVAGGTLPASLNVDFFAERAREAKDRRTKFSGDVTLNAIVLLRDFSAPIEEKLSETTPAAQVVPLPLTVPQDSPWGRGPWAK